MYRVRKGDRVVVSYQMMHMDPEIYPNPKSFKYDRFLNSDGSVKLDFFKDSKRLRNYIQPFGMGAK